MRADWDHLAGRDQHPEPGSSVPAARLADSGRPASPCDANPAHPAAAISPINAAIQLRECPLKTLYVLFFIELHTRQVRVAGVTDHPNGPWVVQRARELSVERPEGTTTPRFLIRDRDSKFTRVFDDVFASDGTQVITTPVQAPNANAHAERWIRTVRQECLDWMLIWGRRHLERILDEYVRHYNDERPHRSLALRPPRDIEGRAGPDAVTVAARVRRRNRLGGLVHEYYQVAA
jgi:hypothetical protein